MSLNFYFVEHLHITCFNINIFIVIIFILFLKVAVDEYVGNNSNKYVYVETCYVQM